MLGADGLQGVLLRLSAHRRDHRYAAHFGDANDQPANLAGGGVLDNGGCSQRFRPVQQAKGGERIDNKGRRLLGRYGGINRHAGLRRGDKILRPTAVALAGADKSNALALHPASKEATAGLLDHAAALETGGHAIAGRNAV